MPVPSWTRGLASNQLLDAVSESLASGLPLPQNASVPLWDAKQSKSTKESEVLIREKLRKVPPCEIGFGSRLAQPVYYREYRRSFEKEIPSWVESLAANQIRAVLRYALKDLHAPLPEKDPREADQETE